MDIVGCSLVYFFSVLENIYCFVQKLGIFVMWILLYGWIEVDELYVLILFIYGGGWVNLGFDVGGYVFKQVIVFLNNDYN